jgi:Ser/Thr protein kinase RdoA (MazF antagonist)
VLWRPEGPHVVDLDDACMGPAVQDLWMLVSGDATRWRRSSTSCSKATRSGADFDDRERG